MGHPYGQPSCCNYNGTQGRCQCDIMEQVLDFPVVLLSTSIVMAILSCYCFFTRLASCMLASGSDDGTFSIQDLRMVKVFY